MNRFVSKLFILFSLLYCLHASCFQVGNPGSPLITSQVVFLESSSSFSGRLSFLQDYVYRQKFHEALYQFADCTNPLTYLKQWTQAAVFTINLKERLDVYGILGGTRLEMKNDFLTSQQFLWGAGGKLIIFDRGNFCFGCDFKYTESDPKPEFFECGKLAYNIVSDFHYGFRELQTALGLSYRTKHFSPYANASYLVTKLRAMPPSVTVKIPTMNLDVDVKAASLVGFNRFGVALGATVTDRKRASFTFEWRGVNQNAVDISGDLRF